MSLLNITIENFELFCKCSTVMCSTSCFVSQKPQFSEHCHLIIETRTLCQRQGKKLEHIFLYF